jgi:hypothetical protein
MKKNLLISAFMFLLIAIIVLFSIEESRTFIIALGLRVFFFVKKNIIMLVTAFFLVKGKFILMIFLKKIAFLSATGLGKRYLIEKVITHNLKIHFLDGISDDIKRLLAYIKNNFKDFPLVKQIIAGFVFLGSLGFVGKFMGGMLAMKVFIAKFWSFLLAISLKVGTGVMYFFTDYLWGSWLAPLIEVFLFSWIFQWLEKVPFLKKFFVKIYNFFSAFFTWTETYMEKIFHIPVKRFFKYIAKKIKKYIYAFIGYERVSAQKRLKEIRELSPSKQVSLTQRRNEKVNKRKQVLKKREERLLMSTFPRSRH